MLLPGNGDELRNFVDDFGHLVPSLDSCVIARVGPEEGWKIKQKRLKTVGTILQIHHVLIARCQ